MESDIDRVYSRRRTLFCCVLLSTCIVIAYWGVQHHGFVNIDDSAYVVDNRHVQGGLSGAGFLWALGSMEVSNWHPLTWLSLMLDYELYGLHAGGYHGTNLMLHLWSSVLLFLLLQRMTGAAGRSFFVALLFGIHPLHVESVAWVAERKDVLSGFFWMATLWCYVWYAERAGWRRYVPVVVSFVLGLMSKPMVVTLPFVLLLLDYWPLGRFPVTDGVDDAGREGGGGQYQRRSVAYLLLEKVPLFVLVGISCAVTYVAQSRGAAVADLARLSLSARVGNAFVSYAKYMEMMLWPEGLAVFYPHPGSWALLPVGLAVLFFVSVSGVVVYYCRRYPYVFTGWWWYAGTLVPVIGLVQVGGQAMADRYTYLPLIGLFIMIAWGTGDLLSRRSRRLQVMILGMGLPMVIMTLMFRARIQTVYWRDSVILFEHALQVTKNNYLAHNNLGLALLDKGELAEADRHFYEAIRIKPNYGPPYSNIGFSLIRQGKRRESLLWFERALQIRPNLIGAQFNLAEALFRLGRFDEAVAHYRSALQSDPGNPRIHNNLGVVLTRKGNLVQATAEYRTALQLDPRHAGAHNNLAMLLLSQGWVDEAILHFRQALAIQPDYANAHYHLAGALKNKGLSREADAHFREAQRINSSYEKKGPATAGGILPDANK